MITCYNLYKQLKKTGGEKEMNKKGRKSGKRLKKVLGRKIHGKKVAKRLGKVIR